MNYFKNKILILLVILILSGPLVEFILVNEEIILIGGDIKFKKSNIIARIIDKYKKENETTNIDIAPPEPGLNRSELIYLSFRLLLVLIFLTYLIILKSKRVKFDNKDRFLITACFVYIVYALITAEDNGEYNGLVYFLL